MPPRENEGPRPGSRPRPFAYGSSVDGVIADIKRMIILDELKPGEHIRQDHLAHALGVTRVPIREAFKALVADGILTHHKNQGHRVAMLSAQDLNEIYGLRAVLEDILIDTSEVPSPELVAKARATNARMAEAARTNALDEFMTQNRAFHFLLFSCSPRPVTIQLVERLWNLSDQYRSVYLRLAGTQQRVLDEHEGIVEALERFDIPAYKRLMRSHRSQSARTVTALISSDVDDEPADKL
jgi:DNA-binding GntR family transcriptional regulator